MSSRPGRETCPETVIWCEWWRVWWRKVFWFTGGDSGQNVHWPWPQPQRTGGAQEEYMRKRMFCSRVLSPSFISSHLSGALWYVFLWLTHRDVEPKDQGGVQESLWFTSTWGPCRCSVQECDEVIMRETAYVWLKKVPFPPDSLCRPWGGSTTPLLKAGVPDFTWWNAAILQEAWGSPEMGNWQ